MRVLLPWLSLLLACSPAPSLPDAGSGPTSAPLVERVRESGPAAAASEPRQASPAAPRAHASKPPKNSCLLARDQTLGAGELALALMREQVAGVVAFEPSPPALVVWSEQTDGSFARGASLALEAKAERASVTCRETRCELAWVDERARLLAATLESSKLGAAQVLASGVDRRFAPAILLRARGAGYAYTSSVDEAMHTFWLERSEQKLSPKRDLTPAGHGAAGASFVLGAAIPTLVFIDAHAGISPFLELPFDRAGQPGEVLVRTPVSQPSAPPLLSAVQWADGRVEVVFSVTGRAAMTAIARVPLRKAEDPSALLPSSGYGRLAFVAARSQRRALFALEQPSAAPPDSPRSLVLKLLDGARTDDGPRLAPGSHAPSLAAATAAGEYWLAYLQDGAVHGAHVRCDD